MQLTSHVTAEMGSIRLIPQTRCLGRNKDGICLVLTAGRQKLPPESFAFTPLGLGLQAKQLEFPGPDGPDAWPYLVEGWFLQHPPLTLGVPLVVFPLRLHIGSGAQRTVAEALHLSAFAGANRQRPFRPGAQNDCPFWG